MTDMTEFPLPSVTCARACDGLLRGTRHTRHNRQRRTDGEAGEASQRCCLRGAQVSHSTTMGPNRGAAPTVHPSPPISLVKDFPRWLPVVVTGSK